MYLFLKYQQQI